MGFDLSNEHRLASLSSALLASANHPWRAAPMLESADVVDGVARDVRNPADLRDLVGTVVEATSEQVSLALSNAVAAAPIWQSTPVDERADCLARAADLLEAQMHTLMGLVVREAGKSLANAVSEIREAIDFLRYYSAQIRSEFSNDTHRPLGPVVCISPWNFPLAIFMGQVAAALAAGNPVLVRVAKAERAGESSGLELPGSMQPLQDSAVYARANGYVRAWNVDIGAHVKKGDVLAVLEIPDIDQELLQSRATAAQSKAGIAQSSTQLELANANTKRYSSLGKTGVVSQQDVDQYQATFDAQKANLTAAQAAYNSSMANVNRLQDLKSFGTLTAPFDGVITMRTAEVGQLVVSGAGGQPLFRVAQVDTLRVFINVPQLYAGDIHLGMKAPVRVRELRNRVFDATVTRTSNAINATNRSLLTEVDIPNPDGVLLAGMYARVALDIKRSERPLVVPSTAVLFDAQGTRCATLQGGVVRWKKVEIEGDLGDRLSIASGLAEGDLVVVMPSEQLVEGMQLKGEAAPAEAAKK